MISDFIEQAKRGESVYICDIREAFAAQGASAECVVESAVGQARRYTIPVPFSENPDEKAFIKEYFYANIYNLISVLGGKRMTIYIKPEDAHIDELCTTLDSVFQVGMPRSKRTSYGKCLNVTDRVNAAVGTQPFRFEIVHGKYNETISQPEKAAKSASGALDAFRNAVNAAQNATICGLDIGGTAIKVVCAVNGRIIAMKDYYWRPSDMTTIDELLRPIIMMVRIARAVLTLPDGKRGNELREAMLRKHTTDSDMQSVIESAEKEFGEFILLDGIGVSFPDVVINNKIVGGETPKTQGIYKNSSDYEAEFSRLGELRDMLLIHCKQGGAVNMANDGSLAAYTAAVELAHSEHSEQVADGVFAYALGTDLGTGWIDEFGEIPQIPLEMYNCVIDLGSWPAKEYDATDVRSIRNFTTGIAGTPQKYTCQSGAFRFAVEHFLKENPVLYKDMIEKDFIEELGGGIYVVFSQKKMRKPLLDHIMELADSGQPQAMNVFRAIGRALCAIWSESEFILRPLTKRRVLLGSFVKRRNCFKLICEGASEKRKITLDAGDDSLAFTSLMLDLKADPNFTVAQFGQAVGAVYYAAASLST